MLPRYGRYVSRIASDLEPLAPPDQLRKVSEQLRAVAGRLELSSLLVADDGTLVLHVDGDLCYWPVITFVNEATHLLGAVPRVVVDTAPGAGRYRTQPL